MKRYYRLITALLLGGAVVGACKDNEYDFSVCSMAVDREAIVDVAAQNPGQEVVVLTTERHTGYSRLLTGSLLTPQ
ncbi:unknown [Bacteroides sp. CAG:709]|nr:unknown [Bacteroides sp. CAG:709]